MSRLYVKLHPDTTPDERASMVSALQNDPIVSAVGESEPSTERVVRFEVVHPDEPLPCDPDEIVETDVDEEFGTGLGVWWLEAR